MHWWLDLKLKLMDDCTLFIVLEAVVFADQPFLSPKQLAVVWIATASCVSKSKHGKIIPVAFVRECCAQQQKLQVSISPVGRGARSVPNRVAVGKKTPLPRILLHSPDSLPHHLPHSFDRLFRPRIN